MTVASDKIPRRLAESAILVSKISKIYSGGHAALTDIDLAIRKGEIFALLGPNGAGKTTLINIICGIVTPTSGRVNASGHDIVWEYKKARAKIGLVPQELTTDAFETVWNTVAFSRGLFGKKPDLALIERILRDLALWDRKDSKIITLSGGMKRRVRIAKALSHEPEILFLDEPTAGVDVELRHGMWDMVRKLQQTGVTIILTTHYIEEAEEMADRIGVINGGRIVLVEDKSALMSKLGKKELRLSLHHPMQTIPVELSGYELALEDDGDTLVFIFNTQAERTGTTRLLGDLDRLKIRFSDLDTRQSSLEDIFVRVVGKSS